MYGRSKFGLQRGIETSNWIKILGRGIVMYAHSAFLEDQNTETQAAVWGEKQSISTSPKGDTNEMEVRTDS